MCGNGLDKQHNGKMKNLENCDMNRGFYILNLLFSLEKNPKGLNKKY